MKKRILSILLTLCMVLCLVPTAVFAEGTPIGTENDPIRIASAEELKNFRDRVNNGETNLCAMLTADIVLNEGTFDEDGNWSESGTPEQWTPIGKEHRRYCGTFDGGGYTIKGLYVNGSIDSAGLFGIIAGGAAISNLIVTGFVAAEGDGRRSGGIVGEQDGGSIMGCINACTVQGYYCGGLAGEQDGGSITGCINTSTVQGYHGGGIVGAQWGGSITNCYNIGTINGMSCGGIASEQIPEEDHSASITNCYSIGKLADYGCGILNYQKEGNTSVNNCYYLAGTAEDAVAIGQGTQENVEDKTKTQFADGTVLELLKNGDENSPWTKCGYLAAAGMTLPLLSWQTADAHTHDKNGNLGGCDCGQLPAGTAGDPYLIYTAEDLKLFRDMVNGGDTGICAKLMNDIVLNDGTFDENGSWSESGAPDQWTPIGDISNPYAGTFDGDGHTIQGVYVNYGGDAGLFSSASGATIKGLTITGYIKGKDRVGGIVGYMSSGTITGCRNTAVVRGEQSSYIACGGIAGRLTTGTIANCENVGSVQATPSGDGLEVGGIVGHAGSYNTSAIFEACANLGSVTAIVDDAGGYARVGGITGFVAQHVDLIDCYNAGSLLLTEQKGTPADSCLGGIFGCKFDGVYSSESELPSASNCYNVGTMTHTGNGKVAIGDIGGETPNIKIINCYGLTGKTKAEFADGTVLALLKGDRTDSPWADECQYLAAAGMTLPVFKGQGDSHEHSEKTGNCLDGIYCECSYLMHRATSEHNWGAWTSNGNDTHSHRCQNAGCTASETDNCSGGTATCTEQATCEICGEKYGTMNPDNHTGTLEWTQTATTHRQEWSCCHVETVAAESHEWASGVCAECGYGCEHTGGTATCTDKALCEICGEKYGDLKPHSYSTEWSTNEASHWHECTECGAKTDEAEHTDTNKDHRCDICEKVLSDCTDIDKDHKCDLCGKVLSEHTGGTATCKDKAICEICGESYGELDSNNHTDLNHIAAKAATESTEGNIEYWYCADCEKYFSDKDCTNEITFSDTVIEKLAKANKSKKSPQTGNDFQPMLWFALLLSGGAATATIVYGRKKKRSVK